LPPHTPDAISHVLADLKPYTAEDFLESHPVNESKKLTTAQALNLLRQRGYIITDAFPVS